MTLDQDTHIKLRQAEGDTDLDTLRDMHRRSGDERRTQILARVEEIKASEGAGDA